MMRFELITSIAVSDMFSIEIVSQQLHGRIINVDNVTLLNAPIAVGVAIATVFCNTSPFCVSAMLIGPTVPPVATAMFPVYRTLYMLLQAFDAPLIRNIPESSRC